MTDTPPQQIALPERLVSSVDLSRLIRELNALDESLRQTELRKPGEPTQLARSSTTLEDLAQANKIQLTDETQRAQLLALLNGFKAHAPRVHMSLATEPSAKFTHNIVIWMRKNIHPLLLLEVGLQPTLAAGCMIRTNNKLFDLSLRHKFTENRALLVQKITEISEKIEAEMEAAALTVATAAATNAAPVAVPVAAAAVPAPTASAPTAETTAPTPTTEAAASTEAPS
jgi:hypothetical protein